MRGGCALFRICFLSNLLAMVVLLFVGQTTLMGQTTAQVTGLVTDSSGASVPGATVTVANLDTGIKVTTLTNAAGNYAVLQLLPGNYSVGAVQSGFKTIIRSPIKLDIGQTARIDFTLEVGDVTETVNVTSTAPLLQTQTADLGQVIGATQMDNLPLNGRNFLQLATITPGALPSGSGFFIPNNAIRVNAMLATNVTYMVDGVNSTDQEFSGTTLQLAPDAIQEFNVETNNLDASYGLTGAVVAVQIKSGTNSFHGNVYEYLRNDALDARGFFAKSVPALKQNQFGFTLGGPIKKDRTFFFGDYQGTRIIQGNTVNNIVPTAAMRSGNYSGQKTIKNPYTGQPFEGNQIPTNMLSSQANYFLKFIPLANSSSGTYIDNFNSTNRVDQFDVKIDHQLRAPDALKVSYSMQRNPVYLPGSLPENGGISQDVHSQRAGLAWTHTLTNNFIHEFNIGYIRTTYFGTPQGAGTNYTEQSGIGGFAQTDSVFPGFPNLSISGYTSINGNTFRPIETTVHHWVLGDHITLTKGTHTISAGFDARWFGHASENAAYSRGSFSFTGTYTGDGFADYLLGLPLSSARSFARNQFGFFNQEQGFYVSDNWKVRPSLTLNLGLRYPLIHPSTVLHNMASSVDPIKSQIVVASTDSGEINTTGQSITQYLIPQFADIIVPSSKVGLPPSLRYMYHNYLDPRLGLAWNAGRGFVFRLGYAIIYVTEEQNLDGSTLLNIPFLADQTTNSNTTPKPAYTLANSFPPISSSSYNLPPLTIFQQDPNRPFPYMQQWNIVVQKVIRGAVSVEAGYVGSKGTHFPFSNRINIPAPGPGVIQSRRPNTRFSAGSYITNADNPVYESLQTKAQTRAWRGLSMLATYTWSKALSYQPQQAPGNPAQVQGSPVQDPQHPFSERALDPMNLSHRFTLSAVYALPFLKDGTGALQQVLGGWQVTSIVTAQSGFPFTPTIGTDPANTGTSARPNRTGNGVLSNPTIDRWFDVGAFSTPAQYTFGNSGLNILNGPGFKEWDCGLFKNFKLTRLREGASLQFRAEAFNVTNTASFSNPATNIQTSTAGKITSTRSTPRQIQFALKIYF